MQLETTSSSQHLPAYLHWCPYIMSFLLLLLGSSAWAPIQDQLYPCGCEVDPILSYLLKDVSLAVLPTLSSFIDSFMAPPPRKNSLYFCLQFLFPSLRPASSTLLPLPNHGKWPYKHPLISMLLN